MSENTTVGPASTNHSISLTDYDKLGAKDDTDTTSFTGHSGAPASNVSLPTSKNLEPTHG